MSVPATYAAEIGVPPAKKEAYSPRPVRVKLTVSDPSESIIEALRFSAIGSPSIPKVLVGVKVSPSATGTTVRSNVEVLSIGSRPSSRSPTQARVRLKIQPSRQPGPLQAAVERRGRCFWNAFEAVAGQEQDGSADHRHQPVWHFPGSAF